MDALNKLAKATFDSFYFESGIFSTIGGVERLKPIILHNQSLLSTQLEKHLFLVELKNIIFESKILPARVQQRDYGQVLANDYPEMFELHEWLLQKTSAPLKIRDVKPLSSFQWLKEPSLLLKFKRELEEKFIDPRTSNDTFIKVFSSTSVYGLNNKIIWIKKAERSRKPAIKTLVELLFILSETGYIEAIPLKYDLVLKKRIENCFCDPDNNPFTILQANFPQRSSINRNPFSEDYHEIKDIIGKIK